MANVLTFSTVHKSITSLNSIDLPAFTVLTGRNGSGKTHLLTAIRDGRVVSSLVNDKSTDVRFFDWATIVPKDTGIFDPWQENSRRSQWFSMLRQHRDTAFSNLQQQVVSLGVPYAYCTSIHDITSLTAERLRTILNPHERAEQISQQIAGFLTSHYSQIYQNSYNQIGDNTWRATIAKIFQKSPKVFACDSQYDFFNNTQFLWGDIDAFQQAFGKVFTTYRELMHENTLLERYPPNDNSSRGHLSDEEFVETYGEPPWDFVNRILEECNLDFRVDHPPLHETSSYEPKLTKVTSHIEMKFEDLSSGEKVLMSFALCIYNTEDKRQSKIFPKLLLLDEVDAPLHPSMTASLLKTIKNVLVDQNQVAVILTTHSPSTVALAPEESLYAMNPEGPKVEKIRKSSALSLLTVGVPTLSISFTGRRQVLVESASDAELYDTLYQKYKDYLATERSLQFVEVGLKDCSGGERNAGCEQVFRLVQALAAGGNESVLGLVDWDGVREPSGRVHVLSPSRRNGLENLVFDPLLLVGLVVRENPAFALQKGLLTGEESYVGLGNWTASRWQVAVDAVEEMVLGNMSDEFMDVEYLVGFSLRIRRNYLHCDDHELEKKIKEAFGFLIPRSGRAGALMRHVIATTLVDFPGFLPRDLLDTFQLLLQDAVA